MLKREDVYYIVVPIVTWVISLLCTYIFNNITGTKQWRLKREKSPGERYIEYFVRIIVIGALILFLNMLIEGFISSFIGTPLRVGGIYWCSNIYWTFRVSIYQNEKNRYR